MRSGLLTAAALALAGAAVAAQAVDPINGIVVRIEADPVEPVNGIVTARDPQTGATFSFSADGAALDRIRLRQSVSTDASGQWAIVGGRRLRVVAAEPVGTPAEPVGRPTVQPAEPVGRPTVAAVTCSALSVNGSNIVAGSTLTVLVNGRAVARHDEYASGELGEHLQPGPNTVRLAFAAPGEMGPFGTQAELRCRPAGGGSSRRDILRLQPTRDRLSAEVQVNYQPR